MEATETLLAEYARLFGPGQLRRLEALGQAFVEGCRDGPFVLDTRGRRYLDCRSGAGTFNLGRAHPELRAELRAAAGGTDQGNFALVSREKAALARALARFTPGDLECSVLSVMRGETIELACKLARGATARPGLIALEGGYHGETGFALSLAAEERYGPLLPEVRVIPHGDLEAARRAISGRTAALVLEPVQVENHCRRADSVYLHGLQRLCRESGAVLILDETQTGFGRTGRRFACEHAELVPDVLVLGEALGGGMFPIAATVFTRKLRSFLDRRPLIHLSTFGGSDIGCRVALRALEIFERERPWTNAAALGELLGTGLEELIGVGGIRSVAGCGLVYSLDLGDPESAKRLCRSAASRGLLVVPGRVARHTVIIRPSLLIDRLQAEQILVCIRAAAVQADE